MAPGGLTCPHIKIYLAVRFQADSSQLIAEVIVADVNGLLEQVRAWSSKTAAQPGQGRGSSSWSGGTVRFTLLKPLITQYIKVKII